MQSIKQLFKQHPVSIVSYLIYSIFWYSTFSAQLKFHAAINKIDEGEKVAWGEGVLYGYFFTGAIAILFTLVIMANMIAKKDQALFYGWLLVFIIAPLIILWNI